MTGLVEMASIPSWRMTITENGRVFDDSSEPGGNSSDKYNNINEIPTWKRSFLNSNSKSRDRVRPSSTSSADKKSSQINNNVKFSLGDDTTEVNNMEEDGAGGCKAATGVNGKVVIDSTHLKHVQSNPFFVELGGVTHPHSKLINDSLPESPQLSRSDSVSTCTTEEEQNDYSPHSGIVEKLRKKFTSLQSSNENTLQSAASRLKRYGSLDNLLDRGVLHQENSQNVKSPSQKNYVRGNSQIDITKTIGFQRIRADKALRNTSDGKRHSRDGEILRNSADDKVEMNSASVNDTLKPVIQKPPKIVIQKTELVRKDSSSSVDEQSQRSPKPRASEMQISSDDIIIIEQPPKSPVCSKNTDEQDTTGKSRSAKTLTTDSDECELPKPNTVSTFRSLFEANTKVNRRKILPDAPRSPKFISASMQKPPVSRSKPSRGEKLKVDQEKPVQQTEVPSLQELEDISSSQQESMSTESVSSVSFSSTLVPGTKAKVSSRSERIDSSSSSQSSDGSAENVSKEKSETVSNSTDKQTTDNDHKKHVSSIPVKPPRAFDSPVTKKKHIGEMKSIFDSNVIVATGPKSTPVQKEKKPVSVEQESNEETSVINKGASVQNFVDNGGKSEQNGTKPVLDSSKQKAVAPMIPNRRQKSPSQQKSVIPATERKQIFDSSSIVVVKTKENIPEQEKKMVAPPRPKAKARKISHSNSIEEDSTGNVEVKLEAGLSVEVSVSKENTPVNTSQVKSDRLMKSDKPTPNRFAPVAQSTPSSANNKLKSPEPEANNKTSLGLSAGSTPAIKISNFEPVGVLNQKNDELSNGRPTKGIPTIIANRFMKDPKGGSSDTKSENKNESDEDDDETTHALVKPSHFRARGFMNVSLSSPVPKKRGQPSQVKEPETALDKMRNSVISQKKSSGNQTNIEDLIRGKKNSPSAVFNSNTIPAKKSEVSASNGVPPLDLSLIEEKKNHPYQDGYIPTKIEPCKIKFIGAGMKGSTQPMVKTKKRKLKISFDDAATATHEYQSENAALHDYLVIHPTEEDEVKKEEEEKQVIRLEELQYADESSDDVAETPHNGGPGDSTIRSNTPLSGSGTFGGYKSKMSYDFEFGMSMAEEPPVASPDPDPIESSEDMDLLPLGEDDTFNWTDNSSADLLF